MLSRRFVRAIFRPFGTKLGSFFSKKKMMFSQDSAPNQKPEEEIKEQVKEQVVYEKSSETSSETSNETPNEESNEKQNEISIEKPINQAKTVNEVLFEFNIPPVVRQTLFFAEEVEEGKEEAKGVQAVQPPYPNELNLRRGNMFQELKKLARLTPVKAPADGTFNEAEEIYRQKCTDAIKNNEKTRIFQNSEYFKGEPLVDDIPLEPSSRYLLEDFIVKTVEEQDIRGRFYRQHSKSQRRDQAVAQRLRSMNKIYHQKQHKYEVEEFQRYLANYPGTTKGPRIEDDVEAYIEYGKKKMPRVVSEKIKLEIAKLGGDNSAELGERLPFAQAGPLSLMSGKRETFQEAQQKQKQIGRNVNMVFAMDAHGRPMTQDIPMDIPRFPNTQYKDYQSFMNELTNWCNFRSYYLAKHIQKNLDDLFPRILKIISFDGKNHQDYLEFPNNIPSLCRYYRCLPKSVQDQPGIKDIYLGLEYKSPDFKYQEKEVGLNWVATQVLPYDIGTERAMTDFTAKKKSYVTPFLMDRMFNMNPVYTWDINSFLNEIKQQELRGEISQQQKNEQFPEPPEKQQEWDDAPSLPVDYYDNEDGFWTPLISAKLKRYDQCKPMLKTRKHFKH